MNPESCGPDEVGGRDAAVGEGQLGGVRAVPADLLQASDDAEPGGVARDHDQRDPAEARPPGAHPDHDPVGARPGGDVDLRAVDHVLVAVALGPRAQRRDVRAPVGLGDRQGRDRPALEDRPDEPLDLLAVAGGDHVRQRDAVGEQAGGQAPAGPGLDQLLGHHQAVDEVTAAAADLLGEAEAQQPGGGRALVQGPGDLAGPLPLVEPGQHVAGDEVARQLAQRPCAQVC